uniref:Uncharacterized protein n=1 Tax=Romanomermis culicivorax TaxID=13658 RepID=A0A915JFJ5_ROMCU
MGPGYETWIAHCTIDALLVSSEHVTDTCEGSGGRSTASPQPAGVNIKNVSVLCAEIMLIAQGVQTLLSEHFTQLDEESTQEH